MEKIEGKTEEQKKEQGEKVEGEAIKGGEIAVAILGYILPFLFFIPLLEDSGGKNKFAKFHANQQLIFLIFLVVGLFVAQVLKIILIGYALFFLMIFCYIFLMIISIISVMKKENKTLPIIGGFEIIS